jgi:lipopolysaccharide export system permease protein
MTADSELVVMRGLGFSPLTLAKPALALACGLTLFLMLLSFYIAPKATASVQHLRQTIKAEATTLLFREGVFNQAGKDLMVYLQSRGKGGVLEGLIIHDARPVNKHPITIVAKSGMLVSTDSGRQVLVYDGSRQDYDKKAGVVNRLKFDQYTIDVPEEGGQVRKRWKEPEERTFYELLNPDLQNPEDKEAIKQFRLELHKRFLSPFLCLTYATIALCCLLLGQVNRRGQSLRIGFAIICAIILQSLYLAGLNLAKSSLSGFIILYLTVFGPMVFCALLLAGRSFAGFNKREG